MVARLLGLSSLVIFALAALGIIPLAALIGKATEALTAYLGPKLGGLLNATFDNAAELSITVISVAHGLTEFVKAAITGSIISNTLLCLGLAALIGGLRHGRLTFDREEASRHAMLMLLAVAGLALPTLFAVSVPSPLPVENVSVFTAGLLLVVYALYVLYTVSDQVSPAMRNMSRLAAWRDGQRTSGRHLEPAKGRGRPGRRGGRHGDRLGATRRQRRAGDPTAWLE